MIKGVLSIIGGIMVLEFLIEWIKSLQDENYNDDYKYCYNCPHGFCMETPKTKGCMKWEAENEAKRTRLDD